MRVFAAIVLPTKIRDHLAQALAMVAPRERAPRDPWVPAVNWHITLAFFGDQPEDMTAELLAHLGEVSRRTPPFPLALVGAGVFRQDICWIGVADPSQTLPELAEQTRGSYAQASQHAHNRFHVTVSRGGRASGRQKASLLAGAMSALSVYRGPEWTVDQVVLMRSDLGEGVGGHPLYSQLGQVALGR
ncbi:MAG: RNA 2',3'-cyclic phosphodiesterase [Propionibacteriaceae bacterium]|jgi:2'-5' RNA ligase|nr:RNA 2',3'-cyclic phosphodiesterase [Propionibacteriaceae bacterium]